MITRPKNIIALALYLLAAASLGCATAKPAAQPTGFAFWPPYPDEPRIQYLCSFQSSVSIAPPKSKLDELVYGKEVQPVQDIVKPYGVDMWNGRIYVCDLRSAAVTVLDLRKQQTLLIGRGGNDSMQTPTDICIAPDGTKYVADLGRAAILVFDANDRVVGTFTQEDWRPVGVAVYEDELFVCDFQKQCVQVLDRRTGEFKRSIGTPGQGDGQFVRPLGIAVDAKGFLYVTDVLNCRLQKFDRSGKRVGGFGMISANVGGMVRPKHIAVDREGVIFVVDAAFQNVQLFDDVGRVFTFFGSAGSHPGSMYLPAGITVHDGDLDLFAKYVHPAFQMEQVILVTNQFGENKVAAYALGRLKPGMTVKDIEASKDTVPTEARGTAAPGPSTLPADSPDEPTAPPPTTNPSVKLTANASNGRK
jgi:streptogramin lyase